MKKKNKQKLAGIAVLSLIGVTSGYFLVTDTVHNLKESAGQIYEGEASAIQGKIEEASEVYGYAQGAGGEADRVISEEKDKENGAETTATELSYTRIEKVETPMYYYIHIAGKRYPEKVGLIGIVVNQETKEEAIEELQIRLPKKSRIEWKEEVSESRKTSETKRGYLLRDGVTVQEYLLRKGYATISSDYDGPYLEQFKKAAEAFAPLETTAPTETGITEESGFTSSPESAVTETITENSGTTQTTAITSAAVSAELSETVISSQTQTTTQTVAQASS